VPEGDLPERGRVEVGDLVTYRNMAELFKEASYKTKVVYGVGIVTAVDETFAKVYWTNAQQFLWISLYKLTKIQSLGKLKPRY